MLVAKLADSDDKNGTWNWNQAAPGMDVNMLGPTVHKHDENSGCKLMTTEESKRTGTRS